MTRLLDRLLGREVRRDIGGMDSAYTSMVSMYGMPDSERILPSYAQYAAECYAGNSVVFSLVQKRIALFSEAAFKYRSLADKHLFGGPGLGRLETPWPNGSAGELWARMEQDVSLAGNVYIRDAGNRLERLRPDWVTIVSVVSRDRNGRQTRDVVGYLFEPVGDSSRDFDVFDVDEVAHWSPIPDPLANFRGMSWLTPVLREIDADVRMTAFRDAYFRNAATPNVILRYQQKLGKDRVERLRDMMLARHTGPENAFKTMVLDEGADLTVVGHNMEGAAFAALQAAGETRLAAAAGVPPRIAGLISTLQAPGRPGEYADAVRAFADLTLRPNWRSACAALQGLVDVPAGSQLWYDVADISALRPGEQDQASTMAQQATTANTLIMAGYTPESVTTAITAGDLSLLNHSGLTSVQLYAPGAAGGNSSANPDATPPPDGEPTAADSGRARAATPDGQPMGGAMVALVPTEADAARLAAADGVPAGDLHCTLLYLGDAADVPPEARQAIAQRLRSLVEDAIAPDYDLPLRADGFAVSAFNPGGGQSCIVLGLGGGDLDPIHGMVADAVGEVASGTPGLMLPEQRTPWVPHLTLTYTGDLAQVAALADRVGPVTFDRLRVAFAGNNVDVLLVPAAA